MDTATFTALKFSRPKKENSNPTGYCLRKGLNTSGDMQSTKESYTGCPIFRAAEAYLNYIRSLLRIKRNLGATAINTGSSSARAGMSTDYQKTINNTDISKEKQDWGSYSAGQQINTTLYNIRRERQCRVGIRRIPYGRLKTVGALWTK